MSTDVVPHRTLDMARLGISPWPLTRSLARSPPAVGCGAHTHWGLGIDHVITRQVGGLEGAPPFYHPGSAEEPVSLGLLIRNDGGVAFYISSILNEQADEGADRSDRPL